ncbi:hypothetical protein [Streptomyces misionensis]
MARYLITYLDAETDVIQADGVEYDAEARDYTFHAGGQVAALVPVTNVRSVRRQEDQEMSG